MHMADKRNPMIGFGMTTAMAAVMLSGCAGHPGAQANVSTAQAQQAVDNGYTQAVQAAEAAVAAEPRNAAHRMRLGNAYLEAGRFASASASFQDAMALGDTSPRAALSLSLALTGQARYSESAALLNEYEGDIYAADLGLALALSGQPDRGIHILSNAIRGGDNTVKVRQNLAYAYAVAGRWREARMMASQDIPAHEVGTRMTEWAQMASADAYQARIANLLGVPAGIRDGGQPTHLALANTVPTQLAEAPTAAAPAPMAMAAPAERISLPVSGGELPSVGAPDSRYETVAQPAARRSQPESFANAFADTAPVAEVERSDEFVTRPVVQPASRELAVAASAPAPRATAPAATAPRTSAITAARDITQPALVRSKRASAPVTDIASDPTHLVQLGSFSSQASAERAWGIYVERYPELADRQMVITQAVVRGRNYWRVSAGGFDNASSDAMCDRVDAASGDGCISWAASSPLPGAVDTGVRLARR
ncbi:SPOR domain-containing protein [Aurantiacibacter aquimixticola]|uniref:SPOR domain-containing protein n=1 Tax=Aurantiacibacter aquimixticola TaxID=1958945 RepID=A0A419RTK1_9SPHN|nr:tetratricopeptide repeat protein [Aurantiacibacter aquimixticola]RJY09117.1 SPOR domain-containing protein [Aurantiacibacter aquimixticola]